MEISIVPWLEYTLQISERYLDLKKRVKIDDIKICRQEHTTDKSS